jgi:hypothetical protein
MKKKELLKVKINKEEEINFIIMFQILKLNIR